MTKEDYKEMTEEEVRERLAILRKYTEDVIDVLPDRMTNIEFAPLFLSVLATYDSENDIDTIYKQMRALLGARDAAELISDEDWEDAGCDCPACVERRNRIADSKNKLN